MKQSFCFLMVAALMAMLFTSCNKVEEEMQSEEEVNIESLTFALQGETATRAILGESGGKKFGQWENGDKIGSIVAAKSTYGYSTINASTTPVTFSVYCKGGFTVGNTINVWYPYTTTQSDPTDVDMNIPAEQYMEGGDFDFSAMPMVAKEITVTAGMVDGTEDHTTVDEINFYNLGSLIDFKVFAESEYTTERVLSVTFNASGNIAGTFSKDMTAIDPDTESTLTITGNTGTSVKTNVIPFTTVGTSSTPLDVYMVVAPGSFSGNVVVVTDAATYTYTISSDKVFQRGHIRSFGLQLDKAPAAGFSRVAHVKGSFSFNLTKASYDSQSASAASWGHGILRMDAAKASATTATNNYMPPAQTSTRFYKNSSLSFAVGSLQIEKVVYTATSDSYATAFANSTWSNATAAASGSVVTIVPTDGSSDFAATAVYNTTGASEVKVYYDNTDYDITKGPVTNGTIDTDVSTAKVNSTVTMTATPASGYNFVSWTVTDAESHAVAVVGNTFQMPASDVTITATFSEAASAKTISTPANANGTVTTDPASSATPGAVVTIAATPNAGYALFSISVVDEDSSPVDVTDNTFTMPAKNVTVTAVFYPYVSWTATTGSLGTAISGVNGTASDSINLTGNGGSPSYSWTYTRTLVALASGKSDHIAMSSGYMQLGSNNALESIVFTTSSMNSVRIKKIMVDTYCNGGTTHKISATVGSTSYIPETNLGSISGTIYSGTGSTQGNITINITNRGSTKKALYVKSIQILYETVE